MIYTFHPRKIALYVNTGKKTANQVKTELGCDVIINGGLYDMKTFKPVLYLKKDGEYLSRVWNGDKPYGFGWNERMSTMVLDADHSKYDNFISCTEICRNGKKVVMSYDSRGGIRGRSAIGVTKDGLISVICSSDGSSRAMTPETLQAYALTNGWKDGIMLDSGGSCQCITPAGKITSSRRVHNFICIWEDETIKTFSKATNGSKKLAKNFTVKEFAVSGRDVVRVDLRLVDILQTIRTHFGKAVNVTRTATQVPNAASIYIKGVKPEVIAQYAETLGKCEVKVKKDSVVISV